MTRETENLASSGTEEDVIHPDLKDDARSVIVEDEQFVMPVLAEEVAVGIRIAATGAVRVRKIVHRDEQEIRQALASEKVEIERVSMDVPVDGPLPVRVEGDVTIIPIVEEVLVVTKQLRLKEELRIIRRRSVAEHTETVTLLKEEAIVERHSEVTADDIASKNR